jgi:hypothetical protein
VEGKALQCLHVGAAAIAWGAVPLGVSRTRCGACIRFALRAVRVWGRLWRYLRQVVRLQRAEAPGPMFRLHRGEASGVQCAYVCDAMRAGVDTVALAALGGGCASG